jgi:hypothetical protein
MLNIFEPRWTHQNGHFGQIEIIIFRRALELEIWSMTIMYYKLVFLPDEMAAAEILVLSLRRKVLAEFGFLRLKRTGCTLSQIS